MDYPDEDDGLPSYQDSGGDDGEISLASLRLDNAPAPNDYVRAEVTYPARFQPRPDYTSLETDGASLMPSLIGQGPEMPYSSRIQTDADSRSNSPTEETSPLGSPNLKFQEFVPSGAKLDPFKLRFQDRRYTSADIKHDTFYGRLASFEVYNWRKTFMDKRTLAKAGFYYEGCEDEVICFGCGGSLADWQPGDNPWREHRRYFEYDCFNTE